MKELDVKPDVFDVAIVGYGPTGLALAYWLGRAGHRVVVIERWPELYALPRAGHVDGEVMRLFQRMGMAAEIAGDSSVTKLTVVRDCDGEILSSTPAENCDQGWEAHYSLFQPSLERIIDAGVRETGQVTVLQGWQLESIERNAQETLKLTVVEGVGDRGVWTPSNNLKEITARWLVGADGANSAVADFVDSDPEDLGYKARALVIFAERIDKSVGADMPDSEVGMELTRPYAAWRESGKRYARWEFLVHDHEATADMNSVDKAWEMISPWGFTPERARLIRHTVFEFRSILANKWRDGNVLIAGDAAHLMPTFQGQGMCSGQRDAAALAWRLDLVLRKVADPEILDSYQQERMPHVKELIMNSAERGQQFWTVDPELARQRDARMREGLAHANLTKNYGAVPSLSTGVLIHNETGTIAPAGQLSPQFEVSLSGTRCLLDDVVGNRWLLLARDATALQILNPGDWAVLDQIDAYVWAVDGHGNGLDDTDAKYEEWMRNLDCIFVLIRPDCYIFGAARDAEEMHHLADSLFTQLHLEAKIV